MAELIALVAMVLEVIKYGHPVLRKKGARVESVTPAIKKLVADMFDTMRAARGIGLAAQQVGEPLQLTIIDVREVVDRPSTLSINGEPRDPNDLMPLVLINPKVRPVGDSQMAAGPEGCLSFPEIFADIERPESVTVEALDAEGRPVEFTCGGLLARAVQHETDHLNGILFIDRMDKETKKELRSELDELQAETKAAMAAKEGHSPK